jgi:murein DD-endopeptidase MepM/ murein hydrolase activator NlpD
MLKTMRFSRLSRTARSALLLLSLPAFALAAARAQSAAVTLTPALVEAGSPELIRVEVADAASIDGEWMGRKLEFFRGPDGQSRLDGQSGLDGRSGSGGRAWFALAGVDVEAAAGPSELKISARLAQGGVREISLPVEILPAHYRTSSLTVAPQFVEPSPEELQRIEEEKQLKEKVFAVSAPEPLWTGSFQPPVTAAATDSFGTRRTFNGQLASIHKGMDFSAAEGTPVGAANRGVVVLARPLYYEGNCVVIDHGLNLFTISMHLSQIAVREGQTVAADELLGLSGATGRVTGPHLHWGVRWREAYLDPAKLLQLNLNGVR